MCTHAFFDDDAKQAFEDASIGMTDRQIFEMMKGEKAEMLSHWRGNDDFFFCHWEAETEADIHDLLEETGMASSMVSMAQEMHRFVTTYDITDQQMIIPPKNS